MSIFLYWCTNVSVYEDCGAGLLSDQDSLIFWSVFIFVAVFLFVLCFFFSFILMVSFLFLILWLSPHREFVPAAPSSIDLLSVTTWVHFIHHSLLSIHTWLQVTTASHHSAGRDFDVLIQGSGPNEGNTEAIFVFENALISEASLSRQDSFLYVRCVRCVCVYGQGKSPGPC